MSKQYDFLLRLLIIGDSGVGKTSLMCRFVDNKFETSYAATIGIDFKIKNIIMDGKRIRLQIWDTAGQERFSTITKQYYRRAQGVLLVYDISKVASFRYLYKWITFAKQYCKPNVQMVLVGNKTDLNANRQVTWMEGRRFARKNSIGFHETSAYTEAQYLDEVFLDLVNHILEKQAEEFNGRQLDSYPSQDSVDLYENKVSSEKCCAVLC